jgi:hypothetical protein
MTALRRWRASLLVLSIALFLFAVVLVALGNRSTTGWLVLASAFANLMVFWLLWRDRRSAG